ncbi:DUF1284 domain-containing protein [Agrobacterium rosae]|uniref:2Fe-2S ferredoxin n=1 Tax=Agrobacterium rosae TaxID=1972867 RepID=A0AAE5VPA6_9HYPH|nr:DUF1284 domain-containing protein [Agrobacterium rosae]KAA3514255.1 DUF1284 domain-containing protein [Agrobacterium rosae]KAA3522921.1 DUF1284 domain-containing protein [Agrobacterium rosae]MCM2433788.1 DUF1284 domain-containing protein [Agrobacterium rosae]MDX8330657.1 DUF1284 domain-containing protein [Agrobacterium rosae]MQB47618.1 DUF1284 domain-containing protein [Agrobacterium rosae]
MTVRLRAHHLLCMLTYVGKGYTPGFTVNYDRVAERLNGGEEIEIVSGPDDICAPLLGDDAAHCFKDSVNGRDAKALEVVAEWLGETPKIGDRIGPDEAFIEKLRSGFQQGHLRKACSGCEWTSLCDRVSQSNFCGVKIAPQIASKVIR